MSAFPEPNWRVLPSASVVYAASCLWREWRPCVELPLFSELAQGDPKASDLDALGAWHRHSASQSDLSEDAAENLTRCWIQCPRPLSMSGQQVRGDVEQRISMLRQQWRARGPGILRFLGQGLPDPGDLGRNQVDILPVLPFVGGAVSVNHPVPGLVVESLLFDPLPELPEIARLTFGLVLVDLESRRTRSASSSNPLFHRVATVVALAACAWVDLVRLEDDIWQAAQSAWCPTDEPFAASGCQAEKSLLDLARSAEKLRDWVSLVLTRNEWTI